MIAGHQRQSAMVLARPGCLKTDRPFTLLSVKPLRGCGMTRYLPKYSLTSSHNPGSTPYQHFLAHEPHRTGRGDFV